MMSRYAADEGRLVFVGNLPEDVRERELDDLFYKYGRIRNIEIKTPSRPPAYAFVEFDDRRDAKDAVYGRDGYDFDGCRLRVEIAKGRGNVEERRPRREFRPPNTGHRVLVEGLPSSASWQDLKDFVRQVVRPAYTNVEKGRDGALGIVEFETASDMDRAIQKLDDTEFTNPFGSSRVRFVVDRDGGRGRGGGSEGRGGRSRSRSRSRSPYDPRRRDRSPYNNRDDRGDRDDYRE